MPKFNLLILLISGLLLIVVNLLGYYLNGYTPIVFVFWLVAVIICSLYFYVSEKKENKKIKVFDLEDLLIIVILFLVFSPLYLAFIYNIPFQVNSDEIVIMDVAKRLTENIQTDIFGMSGHFDFPAFSFILYGALAKAIGGIDLLHMRIIHASFGILIAIISFLFFRIFFEKFYAFGAAALLASNHALLGISRMAMRDNSALLAELLALSLLLYGLKNKNYLTEFFGGIFLGLTLYVYAPGRLAILVWALFIILIFLFSKKESRQEIVKLSAVALLGFLIMALPSFIVASKTSDGYFSYTKKQILIFPEGQKLEESWTGTTNPNDAIIKNISQGLTAFNNKIHDQGYIYLNYNHGFVDPLTGFLIWVGFIILAFKIILGFNDKKENIMILSGFTLLWLLFAFLITKAPQYTRMLIVLPFIAFLVIYGVKEITDIIGNVFEKWKPKWHGVIDMTKKILIFILVITIMAWNVAIFKDFVNNGLKGNALGGTGRYIESKKDIANYKFYLASDEEHPYYNWGDVYVWEHWIGFFANNNQIAKVVSPDIPLLENAPFTVFMNEDVWNKWGEFLISNYPNLKIYNIKQDGSLLAIEVN